MLEHGLVERMVSDRQSLLLGEAARERLVAGTRPSVLARLSAFLFRRVVWERPAGGAAVADPPEVDFQKPHRMPAR